MHENNTLWLRSVLEQIPTEHLDEMLLTELSKEPIDGATIRLILSVLEDREKDFSVPVDSEVEATWQKYRAYTDEKNRTSKKSWQKWNLALRTASVAVIIVVLFFVIPQTAKADIFFEMLARWTDNVFEFLSQDTNNNQHVDYAFETDNPDLQKVYDTVIELGVTDPVVPMWLPDGYELVECKLDSMPIKKSMLARLSNGQNELVFKVDVYSTEISHEYHKDETSVDVYEIDGAIYNIMQNDNMWAVIWTKNNLECFLEIDCQEDSLYKILESIYLNGG